MAGLFGISIDRKKFKGNFLDTLFLGMFYHQHLGERGGFVHFRKKEVLKKEFKYAVDPGHIGTFGASDSSVGIAYYGDANEPFYFESIMGDIAICFSGNIFNIDELKLETLKDGGILDRESDVEVIAEFIVRLGRKKGKTQREKIINGMKAFNEKAKGSYSLLILTEKRIFAVYGPDGRWPLIIGKNKKRDTTIIASETAGFDNLRVEIFRELKPGEVVSISNGRVRREFVLAEKHDVGICDFLWAYTACPSSMFRGVSAATARKLLGALLARRDIEAGFFPHLVIPVPSSGLFHWSGYFYEFWRQLRLKKIEVEKFPIFDLLLLKYTSVRSFLQQKKNRDMVAFYKILTTNDYLSYLIQWLKISGEMELLKGIHSEQGSLIIVVIEDSVVRGTQLKSNIGPKLRKIFKPWKIEIHVRASYPVIKSHCPYSKTTRRDEILAVKFSDEQERIKHLKVDGLKCNTVEDYTKVFSSLSGQICMECTL